MNARIWLTKQSSLYDISIMTQHGDRQKRCKLEGPLPAVFTIKSWEPTAVSKRAAEDFGLTNGARHGQRTKTSPRKRPKHIVNAAAFHRTTNSTPFPFFELPQEIRDQVYSSLVVRQDLGLPPILDATVILKDRKKRLAAQKARLRLNQQRLSSGLRPTCTRTIPEPILHLNLLRASSQVNNEATDCLYSNNWFAISLPKLPSTAFDVPDGWDLARIKKLQLDIQMKDAIRMNRYIDWTSFFTTFPSVQFLRIIPTFHSRYYEWAYSELCDWQSTHYVHKAFFRELLAAVPSHIDLKIGSPSAMARNMELQGNILIGNGLLWDMYADLGKRVDSTGRLLPVNCVVQYDAKY
jgi:hypothetical protein